MSLEITLRQARPTDAEFAYQVLERTMRSYAVATWGTWSESEAREKTSADAVAGRSQVICLGASPVGLVRLDRLATHLQLDHLYVLPEHQHQGIGTHVLQVILAEARNRELPVRLRVLRVNPAKGFYERFGFKITSESPERFYMEHAP